ncbi:MAG TPA: hypothetical protein PLC59_00445 [Bacteroidales bacterium]|jgi:hypothetical protein|nr:hypothetical protein [Bacteroidales bacterium]HQI44533.1 hypothetical protein [Bacteroidales bacterium]
MEKIHSFLNKGSEIKFSNSGPFQINEYRDTCTYNGKEYEFPLRITFRRPKTDKYIKSIEFDNLVIALEIFKKVVDRHPKLKIGLYDYIGRTLLEHQPPTKPKTCICRGEEYKLPLSIELRTPKTDEYLKSIDNFDNVDIAIEIFKDYVDKCPRLKVGLYDCIGRALFVYDPKRKSIMESNPQLKNKFFTESHQMKNKKLNSFIRRCIAEVLIEPEPIEEGKYSSLALAGLLGLAAAKSIPHNSPSNIDTKKPKIHMADPTKELPSEKGMGSWELAKKLCDKNKGMGSWELAKKLCDKNENVAKNLVKLKENIKNDHKITNNERRDINKKFVNLGLDGNGRFEKKEHGLLAITNALDSLGFILDMVTADRIMGDSGHIDNLTYRRINDPGADPFTEKPEIINSRIVFSWYNKSQPGQPTNFEILAYAS